MTTRVDWGYTRLKYIVDCNAAVLAEDTDGDYEFVYVDVGDVSQGSVNAESTPITFADAPSRARRVAQVGDTVVSTVRTYLRAVATVPNSEVPLVFSTGFAVLHPRWSVDPRFLSWYLQGDEFVSRVEANSTGVSYPATTAGNLVDLDLRLPSIAEQRAIADYLDRETTKIDTLIEEQQRLIDLLRERRIAIVAHETQKADESSTPTTLRRVGTLVTGTTPAGEHDELYEDDGELAWITPEGLSRHSVATRRLSEVGRSQVRPVPRPVLICCIGATLGKVGFFDGRVSTNQQITALVTDQDPVFWFYALAAARDQILALSTGNTIPILNNERLAQLPVRVPALHVQSAIARALDQRTASIDTLVTETERFIELARERRSALITAAVTGQIDAREEVA